MNNIHKEYERIQKNIKNWYVKLEKLQEDCPHGNVTIEYGSNTGNYDPTGDVYWKKFNCPDCGKRWTKYKHPYYGNDEMEEQWNHFT